MPENMSKERRKIIKALNAELVLTPADKNVAGSLEELNKIKEGNSNVFVVVKFGKEFAL